MAQKNFRKALNTGQIKRSLTTRYIGKNLIYLKSTDSTNFQATLLGKQGYPEGTLVIAETQTAGKGRLGRRWVSPPFLNLYFSILLRPPISPETATWISLLAGIAVSKTIRSYTGLVPKIKWPNDILIHDKKVSGILIGMQTEGNKINYLILGIGINVNMSRFPEPISKTATSIKKELNQPVSRESLFSGLLEEIEKYLISFYKNGAKKISSEWKALSDTIGKKVRVSQSNQTLEGLAVDLDHQGGLILYQEDGSKVTVMAGDITHLRNSKD